MLTADEAEILACHHRKVAEAMDRLALVQRWRKQCNSGGIGHDARLTWGLGSAVRGYDEMVKIVSALVAPDLPRLLDEAVLVAERDLRVARLALPKGEQA